MLVENKYKKVENLGKREKFKLKNKRVIFKDSKNNFDSIDGLVITSIGSVNHVKAETGQVYECQIAGILDSNYSDSSLVAVGDRVKFSIYDEVSKNSGFTKGIINKIEKRKTKLSRISPKSKYLEHVIASNMEYLIIFMSADSPKYNKRLIDRYLVAAKCGDLKPIICINKIDLVDPQLIYDDLIFYEDLGIDIFLISLHEKLNTKEFKNFIEDKESVITGPSGAGKSSLINYLMKGKIQEIGEISAKTFKGLHTTSYVKMFELGESGKIIDSPGIREFALWDIKKYELAQYFDDFLLFNNDCKFLPCTHIHEPDCAIKKAIEEDKIDIDRYNSYLNLYESIVD